MEEIRLLSKNDIDVRVAQTNKYQNRDGSLCVKVGLLLYKDARVDMRILDELFTPLGWKRSHKMIGDRLYCQVEIWDKEKNEWVSKEDVGVESNTEAEKGQASDAFKRACFNWGIGRELYTAPKISVTLNSDEYTTGQDGRIKVWATFSVGSIGYDKVSRTINSLTIVDKYGVERYALNPAPEKKQTSSLVEARRKAKSGEKTPQSYTPVDSDTYWTIIKCYAKGKPSKSGKDYRTTWIEMTHADADAITQFNVDVCQFCDVNNIPRPQLVTPAMNTIQDI